MGYYDVRENAEAYIKMSEEYRGDLLVRILNKYLEEGKSVLELGMGAGKELEILAMKYPVTGSDSAQPFLDIFRERNQDINLLLLDAINLETDQTFDCIFSNKVLHQLYRKELKESLTRQWEILNPGGLVAHTFWEGEHEEDYLDLHFVYYKLSEIRALFSQNFRVRYLDHYKESETDDSIFVIAEKREEIN